MSDRRPSNSDLLLRGCEHGQKLPHALHELNHLVSVCAGVRSAAPTEILTAVRRGVESGTIKGEVRNESYCDTCGAVTIKSENHTHGRLVTRWYLRIPVSDGGSET